MRWRKERPSKFLWYSVTILNTVAEHLVVVDAVGFVGVVGFSVYSILSAISRLYLKQRREDKMPRRCKFKIFPCSSNQIVHHECRLIKIHFY